MEMVVSDGGDDRRSHEQKPPAKMVVSDGGDDGLSHEQKPPKMVVIDGGDDGLSHEQKPPKMVVSDGGDDGLSHEQKPPKMVVIDGGDDGHQGGGDDLVDGVHVVISSVLVKIGEMAKLASERRINKFGEVIAKEFKDRVSEMLSSLKAWLIKFHGILPITKFNTSQDSNGAKIDTLKEILALFDDISSILIEMVKTINFFKEQDKKKVLGSFKIDLSAMLSTVEQYFPPFACTLCPEMTPPCDLEDMGSFVKASKAIKKP